MVEIGDSPQQLRALLFCLVTAALLLAGFALPSADQPAEEPGAVPSRQPSTAALSSRVPEGIDPIALRRDARLFLTAFFSYEVGGSGPELHAELKASVTAEFAAELLRYRPRQSGMPPSTARLQRLSAHVISADPPRALISGSARRGEEVEQFSFLFLQTASGWRASGAGE